MYSEYNGQICGKLQECLYALIFVNNVAMNNTDKSMSCFSDRNLRYSWWKIILEVKKINKNQFQPLRYTIHNQTSISFSNSRIFFWYLNPEDKILKLAQKHACVS
jgi:hypothetical protein